MKVIDENEELLENLSDSDGDIVGMTVNPTLRQARNVSSQSLPTDSLSHRPTVVGILYGRSVRSTYACLHMYCPPSHSPSPSSSSSSSSSQEEEDDDDDDSMADTGNNDENKSLGEGEAVLMRLQLATTSPRDDSLEQNHSVLLQLRSHVRRFCKPGDLLQVTLPPLSRQHGTDWKRVGRHVETDWQDLRLIIPLTSVGQAQDVLQVKQRRFWTMKQIQSCQQEYCGRRGAVKTDPRQEDPTRMPSLVAPPSTTSTTTTTTKAKLHAKNDNYLTRSRDDGLSQQISSMHHGGLLKRTQGEYLTNFLAHMILYKVGALPVTTTTDPSVWATNHNQLSLEHWTLVREYLNQGSGVLDVAGGSGHVSMALGLHGIQSTIVDPRNKVGHLPGRDRKVWNRAWKQKKMAEFTNMNDPIQMEQGYCQPVQYKIYRAWFGGKPAEVRHPEQIHLPVCGSKDEPDAAPASEMLDTCRALAALHPDEATDAIVETAVQRRIPFVIVPCCVFYRLFPHRRMPNDASQPVSTYKDLLDYLQAKDATIQRTLLPFAGANTLLWSVF